MSDTRHLDWPFFEPHHRELARALDAWAAENLAPLHAAGGEGDVDAACRACVRALGGGGWLRHAVGGVRHGGAADVLDTRALCLIRETLARHHGLADFAFAMQGLGSGAISLAGSAAQQSRYLPRVASGAAIAAFALSEPDAGSDVAALACRARIDGDHAVLDGEKTWISNGGIADFYVVFARSGEAADEVASGAPPGMPPRSEGPPGAPPRSEGPPGAPPRSEGPPGAPPRSEGPPGAPPRSEGPPGAPPRSAKGISAFIVEAGTPGLDIAERIEVIAPHPLARLRFDGCRVPLTQRIGGDGDGFKIAMRTLDVFRTSVAAAALGFARRAMEDALHRVSARRMFGGVLADFQLTQARLATMATTIDSAALLTYRAAWLRDQGANVTREAAMAKLAATEGAQQVIDAAVQLWGGLGVTRGQTVERLYREIRALRIYEGATEVQQLIIGRDLLHTPPA